jgi:hypothetical protein
MRFSNPWIDPRILNVKPEAARAYLLAHGWECLGPAAVPDLLMFDMHRPRGDKPNVLLPTNLQHPYQVQRLVELVTEVAVHEGRYAVEVLNDILAQPAAPAGENGSPTTAATELSGGR